MNITEECVTCKEKHVLATGMFMNELKIGLSLQA